MSDAGLRVERRGAVAVIVLDHPPANTLTADSLSDLAAHLDRLEADRSVAALVITGACDDYFSAGDDLSMYRGVDRTRAGELARLLTDAVSRLACFRGLTVAAINGYCLGGGLELALACDIRLGEAHARLGLPETRVGLLPCGGGTQRLPWLVGEGWAKRLILCGDHLDADTARRIGLIEEAVAAGAALDAALALAGRAARHGPRASAAAKRLIDTARFDTLESGHAREAGEFCALFDSDEPREGISAFFDKRDPIWEPDS